MNIVMLHYHLNHGGVTQVMANQLRALDQVCTRADRVRVAVFCDGQVGGWPAELASGLRAVDVTLHAVPRLRYDAQPVAEVAQLTVQLRAQLSALGYAPDDTILHVHNHGLGKNASLPGALQRLAAEGFALLLQIHDFAEDLRPRNYDHLCSAWQTADLTPTLYPQAAHIHYAVLNQRDRRVLAGAGVPADRLHYLPNSPALNAPVAARDAARRSLHARFGIPDSARFLLSPVRAIRRKNVGEMLLWSVLAGPDTHIGVTLAPLNPAVQPYYQRWRTLVSELQLPVHFEIGGQSGLPFEVNSAAADLILTTSVTEGFGMAFLESWLAERVLVGRDLPEITGDFAAAGVQLRYVSPQLRVPVELIGRAAFCDTLVAACSSMREAYGRPPLADAAVADLCRARTADDTVDFADLDEPHQEQVLRVLQRDAGLRTHVLDLNPTVTGTLALTPHAAHDMIMQNKAVVQEDYSLHASGARLWRAYQRVTASPRDHRMARLSEGGRILEEFLDPTRFRPIRGCYHAYSRS